VSAATTIFLFTDIEGSTRLWEQAPAEMQDALARHDRIVREAIARHRGMLVKSTGDGVHAAFDHAVDALRAALQLQIELRDPAATDGLTLKVRCGLHAGVAQQRRDDDYYGPEVNRAARIMSAAYGGQTLLSQAVAEQLAGTLPAGCTLRDLGLVRLRDLSSPERLHQLVHPQLRSDFAPLRSLDATPNNLAQQLNSFVGRERETAEVKALLAANRLVTLLGMGGIGKSRLSMHLGMQLLDDYMDGVWLVELAPLSDPLLVPQAVAEVLGVKEDGGRPVFDVLLDHVRGRQLLLILDNCEHLLHASAALAKQVLQAAPRVKVLASSRDAMQIAGEAAYHVPALSAPAADVDVSPGALTRHEAVQLFVDRATAAQSHFQLQGSNARAVASICRRLDGIPLAIELAAARTRSLSVEAIDARLDDRFRLLVSGDRTVLPRQRTLRALIDWSHDLLSEPERALFRRLSVFAGGATLEAIEAVGPGGEVEAGDVLDLLSHLVEKSLVVMEPGGTRYRMLDTVRQYALERLDEAGAAASARHRHLGFYLQFAESARPALAGPEQGAWLARLDLERENFLSAHAWSAGLPDAGTLGLRMAHALRPYWIYRGLLSLGLRFSVEVLDRPGLQERNDLRCQALAGTGQMCFFMGHDGEARKYLSESLDIARALGDTKWAAAVLQPLGMACLAQGDLACAREHLREAVTLARELGNRRELAAALNALAMLHRTEGRGGEAKALYVSALELARELDDRASIATILLNLAMVSLTGGQAEGVAAMLLEVLGISSETGSTPVAQSALEVSFGLAAARGEWASAGTFFGAAEAQAQRTGLRRDPADEAFIAPLLQRARRSVRFDVAMVAAKRLTLEQALEQARAWLGAQC
jgi:predicted ATPase/class 3 adenylate cyclase